MSDIDKIMKINEMSANLKKHGFAASSDEAASQAETVYREKIAKDSPNQGSKEGGADKMGSEEAEKMQRNLDVFKSSVQKQIDSVKGEVNGLIGKMNEMIKAINELEKLKDSVTTIDEGSEKQQRLAPKVVKKPASEKPSGSSHPRSGTMQPGDVDISKTFYYGKK